MKSAKHFQIDRDRIAPVLGLAFLWPCLQASGFYPLSTVSSIAQYPVSTVAYYHLVYSVVLVLLALCAILGRRSAEDVLSRSRWIGTGAGIAGSVGSVLLFVVGIDRTAVVVAALACVAFFVVTSILLWATRVSQGDVRKSLVNIAVSFILAQICIGLYLATGLSPAWLQVACPLGSATCAFLSPRVGVHEVSMEFAEIRKLPWKIVIPILFLVYFCVIFIRLVVGDFSGDSSSLLKGVASILCLVAFIPVLLILRGSLATENKLIVIFVLITVVYMVALAAMLVFLNINATLTRRTVIASEHCIEAFLWMVLAFTANRKRCSTVLLFGFYCIVVVAIPWAISFDWFYLSGASNYVEKSAIAIPSIAIALLIAAVSIVVFLTSHLFEMGKKAETQSEDILHNRVSTALEDAGLTEREMDIAQLVYRGYTAKSAAESLYLSEATVKAYTSRVYRKLGIHTKQELIGYIDDFNKDNSSL